MHFADPDHRQALNLLARIHTIRRRVQARGHTSETLLAAAEELLAVSRELHQASQRRLRIDTGQDPA